MNPLDWRLIGSGALTLLAVGAALSLLWLVLGNRRSLLRSVLPAVVAGVLGGIGVWFVSEKMLDVWGAPQPAWFYLAGGVAIIALVLTIRILVARPRWWRALLSVVAALVVLAAVAGSINAYYGYYPTLRAAAGGSDIPPLDVIDTPEDTGPLTTLEEWSPPADMPAAGTVRATTIPGTVSGVQAGTAYVYLPPAYLSSTPPNLPVLVLVHGDPGGPKDWITGGELPTVLDAYAAAHKGLAPIVILPDASASTGPTPSLCLDSNYGNAGTYLATDLPAWVRSTLKAGTHSPTDWAIGGFSYGGTCALTVALNHPGTYPTFLDISGEEKPTIEAGQDTLVQNYFSGDAAAFAAQNPLDLMSTRQYPDTAGIVTVGAADSFYRPQGEKVAAALKKAGISVQLQTMAGAHTWQAWKAGLQNNLDWLMQRYGVLP